MIESGNLLNATNRCLPCSITCTAEVFVRAMQLLINGSLEYDRCTFWMVSMPFCYYRHQSDKITSLLSFLLLPCLAYAHRAIIGFPRLQCTMAIILLKRQCLSRSFLWITSSGWFFVCWFRSCLQLLVDNFWKQNAILAIGRVQLSNAFAQKKFQIWTKFMWCKIFIGLAIKM